MDVNEWLREFSDNLGGIIRMSGKSRREICKEARISNGTLSYCLDEQSVPTARTLLNLSYALDCDVGDLIDFGEPID